MEGGVEEEAQDRVQAAFVLGKRPEDIHVLLVDDERVSRLVVGNLLRKCNYRGNAFSISG